MLGHFRPVCVNRIGMMEIIERTTVREPLAEEIAAAALASADPFEIDHDCINPRGHQPIPSCGEVVCFHCARIIWT